MDDPGLPPKPKSLNLLESLILEEEEKAREANTPSRSTVTRSQEYYDPEKQVILQDTRASSYSLFEMDESLSSSQVVRCDPNAGFRGKKIMKPLASESRRTNQSTILNPSENILKNKSKLQRPFSADYNRNKMRSIQSNGRAKSARVSQGRHVQWSKDQRLRSSDSLVSDSCSSDEEKENDREFKQQSDHGRYVGAGFLTSESEQRTDEKVNLSDTDTSLSGVSSEEGKKHQNKSRKQKVAKGLSRQKKQKLRVLRSDPEKFYGEKLKQKFSELKELMASPLTRQKSQMLQHHLQQIEQLNDQYKAASHGLLSPGLIIPRSLPEDVRHRSHQPTVPRNLLRRSSGPNIISYERDHRVTVQSVQPISKTSRLKTDIHTDTPTNTTSSEKKKKIIDAKLPNSHNDTEESKTDNQQATTFISHEQLSSTPSKTSTIDHHIKFSDNDYLRKWLQDKDKKYRRKLREDRKKKREEKERLIMEANEKLERKIQSQKVVESWMKEKDREMTTKYKEIYTNYKELDKKGVFDKGPHLPGNSMSFRNNEYPSKHGYNRTPPSNRRETIEQNEREVSVTQEINRQHPPQTKFIYKRQATGKISFNMHVRGRNPFSPRQDSRSVETGGGEQPGNTLSSRSDRSSQETYMEDKGFYTSSVEEKEVPVPKIELTQGLKTSTAEMMDKAIHKVNADVYFHAALAGDQSAVAHQEDINEHWSEIDIKTSEDLTSSGSKDESLELSEFEDETKTMSEKEDQPLLAESLQGFETTVTTDDDSDNAAKTGNVPAKLYSANEMPLLEMTEQLDEENMYEQLIELPFAEKLEMDSKCEFLDLPENVKLNDIKNGKEEDMLKEEGSDQNSKSMREQDSDKEVDTASATGFSLSQQNDSKDFLENLGGLPLPIKVTLIAMNDENDPNVEQVLSIIDRERIYEELKDLPLEEKIEILKKKDPTRNPI